MNLREVLKRTSDSEFHRFSSIDYDEIFRLTKKKKHVDIKKKKKKRNVCSDRGVSIRDFYLSTLLFFLSTGTANTIGEVYARAAKAVRVQ